MAVRTEWRDPTEISVQIPESEVVAGNVLLHNSYLWWGGAITPAGQTYLDENQVPPPSNLPTITANYPASGQDGTNVTLVGTNLRADAAVGKIFIGEVEQVRWGMWLPTDISFASQVGTSPLDTPLPVRVEMPDGTVVPAPDPYTFTAMLPATINSFSPVSGVNGTQVICFGANFGSPSDTTKVLVGTEEATIVTWAATNININAVQGAAPLDVAQVVTAFRSDGSEVVLGNFTFTAVGIMAATKKKVQGIQGELDFNIDDLPPVRKKGK